MSSTYGKQAMRLVAENVSLLGVQASSAVVDDLHLAKPGTERGSQIYA